MSGFCAAVRYGLSMLWLVSMTVVSAPTPSQADTGSVRVDITKAGFILGVGGGRGTLTFRGRSYPLRIGGVSFGATIGASKTELIGLAYNMKNPSDIAGTYAALGGGAAVAGGAGAVRLKNSKGVILELKGRKVGLEFSVSLSGLEVSLLAGCGTALGTKPLADC
jgi:hypothetical protein